MLICNSLRNHRLYLAVTVTETKSTLPLILKPPRCSAAGIDAYLVNECFLPEFTVKDQVHFALLYRGRQSYSPVASKPSDQLPNPSARPTRARPLRKEKPAEKGGDFVARLD